MPVKVSDVPLTPEIAALPAMPSGLRVPWPTLYEPDDGSDPSTVDRTGPHSAILNCSCVFGRGRPRFGRPCPNRQRRAVRNRLCVVCGITITPFTESVFIGGEHERFAGLAAPAWASIEPAAHPCCAAYSLLLCPKLRTDPEKIQIAITRGHYEVFKHVVVFTPDLRQRAYGMPLNQPVPVGAVDLYIAIPDPAITRLTTAVEWLTQDAPPEYRELAVAVG